MRVKVKGLGGLKDLIPKEVSLTFDATEVKVKDVLEALARRIGHDFICKVYSPYAQELASGVFVALNGRMINYLNGLDTKVRDGARIAIGTMTNGG